MSEKKNWVKAIYKFDATESNELSIQPGDVILITKNDESGWVCGTLENGNKGWFPLHFTEPLSEEEINVKQIPKRSPPKPPGSTAPPSPSSLLSSSPSSSSVSSPSLMKGSPRPSIEITLSSEIQPQNATKSEFIEKPRKQSSERPQKKIVKEKAFPNTERTLTINKDSAILKSLEIQLEALLLNIKGSLDSSQPFNQQIASLSSNELEQSIDIITRFYVRYSRHDFPAVCTTLLNLSSQFDPKRKKTGTLHSGDIDNEALNKVVENKDDKVIFRLMHILYEVILENDDKLNSMESLAKSLSSFCFDKLYFNYSKSIRDLSAQCLALISKSNLKTISKMFVDKLSKCRTDDEFRKFATYQTATKYLDFGLALPEQQEATLLFFNSISLNLERISRGVLQREICSSLSSILVKVFSEVDPEEYESVFWNYHTTIYNTTKKWTKKTKIRTAALELMSTLICYGKTPFMKERTSEISSLLLSNAKESKSRLTAIESITFYLNSFPTQKMGKDLIAQIYLEQVNFLLPMLLPRKYTPIDAEATLLKECLIEIGKKRLTVLNHNHIKQVLKLPEYTLELKGIVISSFAAFTNQSLLEHESDFLCDLVDSIFVQYNGESNPLKYVLNCFPYLCFRDKQKEIAKKISIFSFSATDDVSSLAITALTRYIQISPNENLELFLSHLLDNLKTRISYNSQIILLSLKALCTLINFYIDLLEKNNRTPQIEEQTWSNFRQSIEAFTLEWLLSGDSLVWTKVCVLLGVLNKPILRNIESSNADQHFLCDYIQIQEFEPSPTTQWFPTLTSFLKQHGKKFEKLIDFVWGRTFRDWKTHNPSWKNYTKFMCLTLVFSVGNNATTFVEKLVGYLVNFAGNSEEVKTILEIIPEIPLEVYPLLLQNYESEMDKKKKKKEEWAVGENAVNFYNGIINSLNETFYCENGFIRKTFRELIQCWLTGIKHVNSVNSLVKNSIIDIIQKCIRFESFNSETSLVNQSKFCESIFQFVVEILDQKDNSKNSQMEISSIRTITSLIEFGNITENFLNKKMIPFLLNSFNLGIHCLPEIQTSFITIALKFKSFIDQFISRSLSKEDQNSSFYWKVLSSVFTKHFDSIKEVCSPEKMLYLSFYFQLAPNEELREEAVNLANFLASIQIFDPGFVLPPPSSSIFLCFDVAAAYSEDLASRYPTSATNLIEVAAQLQDNFSEKHNEINSLLLKLLVPWTEKFQVTGEETILKHLLQLTQKANTEHLRIYLEPLWKHLFLVNNKISQQSLQLVLTFILSNYVKEKNCDLAFEFLQSKESTKEIIKLLTPNLRKYGPSPTDPKSFISFYDQLHKTPNTNYNLVQENGSFNLLANLAYENGLLLQDFLPILLQHAVILYGPTRTIKYPGWLSFVQNLILNMGFRHSSDPEIRKRSLQFVKHLSSKHINIYKEYAPSTLRPDDILELVNIISTHKPNLRQEWANIALEWALQIEKSQEEPNLAEESFQLFLTLNMDFSFQMIQKLTLAFFKFLNYSEEMNQHNLVPKFFFSIQPENCDKQVKEFIVNIGSILLQTTSIYQFHVGLKLLEISSDTKIDKFWKSGSDITKLLFKGLTATDTYKRALDFLITFALSHQQDPALSQMQIVILFVSFILILQNEETGSMIATKLESFSQSYFKSFLTLFQKCQKDMDDPIQYQHIESFSILIKSAFSSEDHFSFIIELLLMLLRRGIARWKFHLLLLLRGALDLYHYSLSSYDVQHFSEMTYYLCYSENSRIAKTASELLPYVLETSERSHIDLSMDLFFFLKSAPSANLYGSLSGKIESFNGETEVSYRENLIQVVEDLLKTVFHLDNSLVTEILSSLEARLLGKRGERRSRADWTASKKLVPERGETIAQLITPSTKPNIPSQPKPTSTVSQSKPPPPPSQPKPNIPVSKLPKSSSQTSIQSPSSQIQSSSQSSLPTSQSQTSLTSSSQASASKSLPQNQSSIQSPPAQPTHQTLSPTGEQPPPLPKSPPPSKKPMPLFQSKKDETQEEPKTEEIKKEEKSEESKKEEDKTQKEMKKEDSKKEEPPKNKTQKEMKKEESKKEEPKIEPKIEVKKEEIKTEEVKKEEPKIEVKKEEIKTEEIKKEEPKIEEVKKEEIKTEVKKSKDESKDTKRSRPVPPPKPHKT